jgi:molybdopterin molybdotransferase
MDGFALKHGDIAGASSGRPKRLEVVDEIPAGYRASRPLQHGQAVRIMTGAAIPEGADCVVMQEDTFSEGAFVHIKKEVSPGENIRRAGEDIAAGEILFPGKTIIRAAHTGILASTGRSILTVYMRPRVAILSTGDELVDIDEPDREEKIVSSNSYSLWSLVTENGGDPISLGIARDTKESLCSKLREALKADIIITSGGVSVGKYDFVKDVFQDLGASMKLWKVAMRPGQPLVFGTIDGLPAFGLPGNPVSAMVSFEQFVRPALRKMTGKASLFRPTLQAVAREKVQTNVGKKYFIRCRVFEENGALTATTTGRQGSGILMSMASANALMIVPEDVETVLPGDTVLVQILDGEFGFTEHPVY